MESPSSFESTNLIAITLSVHRHRLNFDEKTFEPSKTIKGFLTNKAKAKLVSSRFQSPKVFSPIKPQPIRAINVYVLLTRGIFGPDGVSLRGALEAGGP